MTCLAPFVLAHNLAHNPMTVFACMFVRSPCSVFAHTVSSHPLMCLLTQFAHNPSYFCSQCLLTTLFFFARMICSHPCVFLLTNSARNHVYFCSHGCPHPLMVLLDNVFFLLTCAHLFYTHPLWDTMFCTSLRRLLILF